MSTELNPQSITNQEFTTQVAEEASSQGVLGTFGIRTDLFIAQTVNFILVLLVLWRFVYKPILAMLEKREQLIAKSMKDVEEISARVAASDAEYQSMLTEARREAQVIIEAAMHETDRRKNDMITSAKREVENVILNGKAQLVLEREASITAMRKEIIDIAVRAAAKIATEGMTVKKSQSLAEEMVRKMT